MSDSVTKDTKKRLDREKISFAERYRHCNRCEKELYINNDKEVVCALCGETFFNVCINKHQQLY